MLQAEFDLSSSLLSPRLFSIVIGELGVRDGIPVVQKSQIVHVQPGQVSLRVCRVLRRAQTAFEIRSLAAGTCWKGLVTLEIG